MASHRDHRATDVRDEQEVTYRLRDATPADESWLEGLRRRAYADLFDATWGRWDESRHARQFRDCMERGNISVIEVDGEAAGMIQLLEAGDTLKVAEIQIDPVHQNRGVGTHALRGVIASAHSRGLDVHLSVGLDNGKAIRLYERLGFLSVGRSDTHVHMRREAPD